MSEHLLTVADMRALEREADVRGLSYAQMMRNAGEAAAEAVLDALEHRWRGDAGDGAAWHGVVLCGPGNNGGDGLVCAARLASAGSLCAYLLRPRDASDALVQAAKAAGAVILDADHDPGLASLDAELARADVVIDALLGTGVSRPIDGALKNVLDRVRSARAAAAPLMVALDGVTGMDYDTGALDPAAVPADLTVTFHAPKRGHFCAPAALACGAVEVASIGIEALDLARPGPAVALFGDVDVCERLPARRRDGNKGSFGRALVVGGSPDYVGAPALAATAAYRVGAGLVTLNVPDANKVATALLCPEATFARDVGPGEALSLEGVRALVVGPGLGRGEDARRRLDRALAFATAARPPVLVLDADALNILAPLTRLLLPQPMELVLTPHPGEMARLSGLSIADVQSDRIGHALRHAAVWGAVLVLKGAFTVVAAPSGEAVVIPSANPALAVAGTGDVLAGAIAGLAAQGLGAFDAAACGAFVHARAGELWSDAHGEAGLLASDLARLLPDALVDIQRADDARRLTFDA